MLRMQVGRKTDICDPTDEQAPGRNAVLVAGKAEACAANVRSLGFDFMVATGAACCDANKGEMIVRRKGDVTHFNEANDQGE